MAEYIEREAVKNVLRRYFDTPNVQLNTKFSGGMRVAIRRCIESVDNVATADVVDVKTLEAWLYEIAMNNTQNPLCAACEALISRLDGLRAFAKERGRDHG